MISNELRQIISNLKKKLLFPYLQGLFTVIVYVYIAYILDIDKTKSIEFEKVLLYAFSTLSALAVIGSISIPRWFFSSSRIYTILKKEFGPGDWWDSKRIRRIVGKNKELISNLKNNELQISAMLYRTFGYQLIFMALPDMIGTFGFVLSLLSQDYRYAVVFGVVAFLVKLVSFPRIESIAQDAEIELERNK